MPVGRVVDRSAQAREQTDANQRPVRFELERPLDHRDQLGVDHPRRLHVAARGPDRGAGQRGAVAEPLRQCGRLAERERAERSLAGPDPGLAEPQQQLAAPLGRLGLEPPLDVDGARVMLGRLLVREHRRRLLAGAEGVGDRLLGVLGIGAAGEVVGELGQVALAPAPLHRLDRLADPLVHPRPPRPGHTLVQRLPDQRVREQVAPGLLVGLDEKLRRERLVERREELLLGQQHHPLEQRRIDVPSDHGG